MRYKLTIQYDGTPFKGFQRQSYTSCTVQYELETAISKVCNQAIQVHASGRTDVGVHALGQVVHFDTTNIRKENDILRGCNHYLPDTVKVLRVETVDENFHARHSAVSKTYRYFFAVENIRFSIENDGNSDLNNIKFSAENSDDSIVKSGDSSSVGNCSSCDESGSMVVLDRNFAFGDKDVHIRDRAMFVPYLDVEKIKEACKLLVGRHDFGSFKGANSMPYYTTERTVLDCKISTSVCPITNVQLVCLEIKSKGFLYNMVRLIAGLLSRIGQNKASLDDLKEAIKIQNRKHTKLLAPACGLYLTSVEY